MATDNYKLWLRQIQSASSTQSPPSTDAKTETDEESAVQVAEGGTEVADHIARLNDIPLLEQVSEFVKIAIALLDFICIPFFYLDAYIANKPIRTKLPDFLRWMYALVIIGLTVGLIVYPVFLSQLLVTLAAVAFSSSFVRLVNTLYKRVQYNLELNQIENELDNQMNELIDIREQAASFEYNYDHNFKHHYRLLTFGIDRLYERSEKVNAKIQELQARKKELNQEISQLGTMKVADRAVSASVGAASVIGYTVSFFFPPVGAAIITASLAVGLAYFIPTFIGPRLYALIQKLKNQETTAETNHEEKKQEKIHESLSDVLKAMPPDQQHEVRSSFQLTSKNPSPDSSALQTEVEQQEESDDEGETRGPHL